MWLMKQIQLKLMNTIAKLLTRKETAYALESNNLKKYF
jgi:hypothetical protein